MRGRSRGDIGRYRGEDKDKDKGSRDRGSRGQGGVKGVPRCLRKTREENITATISRLCSKEHPNLQKSTGGCPSKLSSTNIHHAQHLITF